MIKIRRPCEIPIGHVRFQTIFYSLCATAHSNFHFLLPLSLFNWTLNFELWAVSLGNLIVHIRQICQQSRRPTNWFRNKVVEGGFFRKLSEISFSFKHQSFVRVEWVSVLADCSHTHRGQTTKTTNKLGRNERKRVFLRKVKVKIENTGGWPPTNLWSNGKDFFKQETEKADGGN